MPGFVCGRATASAVGALLTLAQSGLLLAQPASDPSSRFKVLVDSLHMAVEQENQALAVELLDRLGSLLPELENLPIQLELSLRWDKANESLEYALTLTDEESVALIADKAIEAWIEFINWYQTLTSREVSGIKRYPEKRIAVAVDKLGRAIVVRGNRHGYTVTDLFEQYLNIPVEYFGSGAVDLWKHFLYRCPNWEDTGESLESLRSRFAAGEEACREHWLSYLDFLTIWVEEGSIAEPKKRTVRRDIAGLTDALSGGNDAEEEG